MANICQLVLYAIFEDIVVWARLFGEYIDEGQVHYISSKEKKFGNVGVVASCGLLSLKSEEELQVSCQCM